MIFVEHSSGRQQKDLAPLVESGENGIRHLTGEYDAFAKPQFTRQVFQTSPVIPVADQKRKKDLERYLAPSAELEVPRHDPCSVPRPPFARQSGSLVVYQIRNPRARWRQAWQTAKFRLVCTAVWRYASARFDGIFVTCSWLKSLILIKADRRGVEQPVFQ